MIEIAKLGVGKFFGDQDILQDMPGSEVKKGVVDEKAEGGGGGKADLGLIGTVASTEPYSVVTASSCEIIFLSRESLCEILSGGPVDDDDLHNFLKTQQYFPEDIDIKKKYFEENNW